LCVNNWLKLMKFSLLEGQRRLDVALEKEWTNIIDCVLLFLTLLFQFCIVLALYIEFNWKIELIPGNLDKTGLSSLFYIEFVPYNLNSLLVLINLLWLPKKFCLTDCFFSNSVLRIRFWIYDFLKNWTSVWIVVILQKLCSDSVLLV